MTLIYIAIFINCLVTPDFLKYFRVQARSTINAARNMNTCANLHGKPSNSCWNISVETILMLTLEQKSIRSILLSWHIILQLLSYFHLDRLPDHEGKSFMTYSLRRKSGEHFLILLSFVKTVHSFEMIKNSSYNSTLQEKELPEYNYIYYFIPFLIIAQTIAVFPDTKWMGLTTHTWRNPSQPLHVYPLGVREHDFMLLYSMCAHMSPVTHPVVQKMTQSDLSLD